jgi:hypothetical protein
MTVKPDVMEGVPQKPGWYFAKTVSGWRCLRIIECADVCAVAKNGKDVNEYEEWSERIQPPEGE